MQNKEQKGDVSVNAIAGTHVALLGIALSSNEPSYAQNHRGSEIRSKKPMTENVRDIFTGPTEKANSTLDSHV